MITDKKHSVRIRKRSCFSLKYNCGHCHGSLLSMYIWKFCRKLNVIRDILWHGQMHISKKKYMITVFIIPCFVQMSDHRVGDGFPELPAVQHHRPAVLQPRWAGDHVCVPSHLQHLPAGGGSHICGKWVQQTGNSWQMGKVFLSFQGLVAYREKWMVACYQVNIWPKLSHLSMLSVLSFMVR